MTNGVQLICFYGPESTGKSSLAAYFAQVWETEFVPEVAKEFITSNQFSRNDIINIGWAHYNRILEKISHSRKFLFCDTDAITTEIYSRWYLGEVPAVLYELEKKIIYDHYFLFDIDVPWVADGLRDLKDHRSEMLAIFKEELKKRKICFTLVSGDFPNRTALIQNVLNSL